MIICFGFDCQAVYDSEFEYQTYDECVAEAVGVTEYMQLIFPASAGEIHCWDRETFNIFEGLSFQLFVGGKLDEYTQTAVTNTLVEGFNYLRIKAEFYGVVF